MALSLPEAVESAHMDHPDFRVGVGGRIFATLGYPSAGWAMVKLMPDQQGEFVRAEPDAFAMVKGGWGRKGATNVRLQAAKVDSVRRALEAAWRNTAPKNTAVRLEGDGGGSGNPGSVVSDRAKKRVVGKGKVGKGKVQKRTAGKGKVGKRAE
jgi:hypothetical protein